MAVKTIERKIQASWYLVGANKKEHSDVVGCNFLDKIRIGGCSRNGRSRFSILLLAEEILPGRVHGTRVQLPSRPHLLNIVQS